MRPGRFDRIIYIGRPDFNGRIEILQVACSHQPAKDELPGCICGLTYWCSYHTNSSITVLEGYKLAVQSKGKTRNCRAAWAACPPEPPRRQHCVDVLLSAPGAGEAAAVLTACTAPWTQILSCARQVHLNRRPCADDINLREIAFETQRYSGAQLANLVNLAAGFVGRAGRDRITHADMLQVSCHRYPRCCGRQSTGVWTCALNMVLNRAQTAGGGCCSAMCPKGKAAG